MAGPQSPPRETKNAGADSLRFGYIGYIATKKYEVYT